MNPSKIIIDFLREKEDLRLKAYYPTPNDVPTIGWGTTVYPNGKRVKMGDICTKEEAEVFFSYDVDQFSKGVRKLIMIPLEQHQFDALVSLAYNIGLGQKGLAGSDLLEFVNAKDFIRASKQFELWDNQRNQKTGKLEELPGLVTRRLQEKKLFLTGKLK